MMHSPEHITSIPPAPLELNYWEATAVGAEKPPPSFRQRMEQGTVPPQEMISHLRESLHSEHGMTPEAIKDSAEIMHHFIMRGILEEEQAGNNRFAAHALLKDTMSEARIKEASYDPELPSEAQYRSDARHMTIGQVFKPELSTKEPTDRYMLSYAFVVAHEMGHAITDSIPRHLAKKYGSTGPDGEAALPNSYHRYNLVEQRLQKRLGTAMTGHKETDLHIEEERLGQGFGAIGARSMMRAMNYPESHINQITEELGYDPGSNLETLQAMGYDESQVAERVQEQRNNPSYLKRGQAQIDVLHKVTPDKGPHQLVEGDDDNHEKRNPGMLGYAKPLQAEEVIETLAETEDLIVNGPEALDENSWYNAVGGVSDPEIAKYIRQLRADRRRALFIQSSDKYLGRPGSWRNRITLAAAALAILVPAGPMVVGPFLPEGPSQSTEEEHHEVGSHTPTEK